MESIQSSTTGHNTQRRQNTIKTCLALQHSAIVFIMLINVKMPTNVGILTFMSMIKFMAYGTKNKGC